MEPEINVYMVEQTLADEGINLQDVEVRKNKFMDLIEVTPVPPRIGALDRIEKVLVKAYGSWASINRDQDAKNRPCIEILY